MLLAMASETILSVSEVCFNYGDSKVLEDVSLELKRGQLVSLIGPNGAGKSTLLKIVAGLIKPQSGRIDCRAGRIGYVPQQTRIERQLPLTVGEFLALKKCAGGDAERGRVLGEVGAGHLRARRLGALSGGEFQRVLVAFALLGDPDLLLLDEPLTGVDFRGGMSFHRMLHLLHDELGLTVLMVSHDMHLVEHMSQEIYCLNRKVCCHGAPEVVLASENLERAYGHDQQAALADQ